MVADAPRRIKRRRPGGGVAHYAKGAFLPQWEAFAQAVALGMSQTKAYQKHVALWTLSDSDACSSAAALAARPTVAARISALRAETARELDVILDGARQTAVKILAGALTQTPNDAAMDSPLCELGMSKLGPYPKMLDKLGSIDRLAKMAGWNAPEKIDATIATHPTIDGALKKLFARPERDVTPEPARIAAKGSKRRKVVDVEEA